MRKVIKIIGIIIIAVVVIIAVLVIKAYIDSKKPVIPADYYTFFSPSVPLELKYSQPGEYEVSNYDDPSENKAIKKVRFWFPTELAANESQYPVIVVVNGSNTPAAKYEPWFKRLASWGFVVVGNEDPQAGTGETTSVMLDYLLNLSQRHPLYGKLDTDHIGIAGFSQGGAGALAAVTEYENGTVYMIFLFYTVLFMTITSADQQVNLFLPIKKRESKIALQLSLYIESYVNSFVFPKTEKPGIIRRTKQFCNAARHYIKVI